MSPLAADDVYRTTGKRFACYQEIRVLSIRSPGMEPAAKRSKMEPATKSHKTKPATKSHKTKPATKSPKSTNDSDKYQSKLMFAVHSPSDLESAKESSPAKMDNEETCVFTVVEQRLDDNYKKVGPDDIEVVVFATCALAEEYVCERQRKVLKEELLETDNYPPDIKAAMTRIDDTIEARIKAYRDEHDEDEDYDPADFEDEEDEDRKMVDAWDESRVTQIKTELKNLSSEALDELVTKHLSAVYRCATNKYIWEIISSKVYTAPYTN